MRRHKQRIAAMRKRITKILPMLSSKNIAIKIKTLQELGNYDVASESTVSLIVPMVMDEDEMVQTAAMFALVQIGLKSDKVESQLKALTDNPDNYVKMRGYWVLERINKNTDDPFGRR